MSVEGPKESMRPSLRQLVPLRGLLRHDKLAISIWPASNGVSEGLAHIGVVGKLGLCRGGVASSQNAANSGYVNNSHFGSPDG